jgi:hypothetical protein
MGKKLRVNKLSANLGDKELAVTGFTSGQYAHSLPGWLSDRTVMTGF